MLNIHYARGCAPKARERNKIYLEIETGDGSKLAMVVERDYV
jgi:hypothetical protein